jgi:hypothetical protein
MDTTTLQTIATLANTLSLTGFLLWVWNAERTERIKMRDELIAHLKDDIKTLSEPTDGTA